MSVFRLLIVLCAILTCQKVACAKNNSELRRCTLGNGYPGRVLPYAATPELEAKLDRFRLSAGWYVRDKPPPGCHVDDRKCPTNAIPYLLYTPRNGPRPVPMIIYFGGLGKHGTDLGKQFRQTKVFEKVADLMDKKWIEFTGPNSIEVELFYHEPSDIFCVKKSAYGKSTVQKYRMYYP